MCLDLIHLNGILYDNAIPYLGCNGYRNKHLFQGKKDFMCLDFASECRDGYIHGRPWKIL